MARKRIAVITARADDNEQKRIIEGIAGEAFSNDIDVVVFSNIFNHWFKDEILNFENIIYEFFVPELFDGVIITSEAFFDKELLTKIYDKVKISKIPAVVIGDTVEDFISVNLDDEADFMQIAEHLICVHGFTDIDILAGAEDNPASNSRISGCKKAFEKHGLLFDMNKIHYGNFWNDSGEFLANQYICGEIQMPQAVICANDYMAFGLCDTLMSAGVKIPEQITIIGYEHTNERIYHNPLLTTFERDRYRMGADAVRLILGKSIVNVRKENRLISGNTCSCGVNNIQLNEEICAARIGQYHTVMNSVAQFSSKLTLCRTLKEYTDVLNDFYYLLHGVKTLYLCIEKSWNSTKYSGDNYLCCEISGNSNQVVPKEFQRKIFLPVLNEMKEKPSIFYANSLCFQDRLFGYTVLEYDYPTSYDFSFRDWNKTAANALEILRMKNDIQYLKQCQSISSLYDSLTGFYNLREFCQILDAAYENKTEVCFLKLVKMNFCSDGEFLYGENYRNDILSTVASAIKKACTNNEICCRAGEDMFIILHKNGDKKIFSDKINVINAY